MRRREFLGLVGGTAAWPAAALAQQTKMPVVGYLSLGSRQSSVAMAPFLRGLGELGYVDGRNVGIEYRFADNQLERLPAMAADLVQRRVDVLVATARTPQFAKAATSSIPIVFMSAIDPVTIGLVDSLNRPGGNMTGATILALDLAGKRFGLLHDLVPHATSIAILYDATSAGVGFDFQIDEVQSAARKLGVTTVLVPVGADRNFEAAFETIVRHGSGAVFVTAANFFFNYRERLVALAARHRIPAAYELRDFAVAGGLMSYATNLEDAYRKVGNYTGRILKGDKPADLPVQLPTKFEFVLNLKTAAALDLNISPDVLSIADEVIE